MSETGYTSYPPPEPDFWIYFAKYLRNFWVQWAIVFVPFILSILYLKFTMSSYHINEKENLEEDKELIEKKQAKKAKNMQKKSFKNS